MWDFLFQVYRGPNTQFFIENLQPKSDYHVRVCAIRQCDSGLGDIMGAFSQGRSFSTLSPQPTKQATTRVENNSKLAEPKPLTDQQWATIIFVGFVIVAFVIAFVTQQVINMRHSSRWCLLWNTWRGICICFLERGSQLWYSWWPASCREPAGPTVSQNFIMFHWKEFASSLVLTEKRKSEEYIHVNLYKWSREKGSVLCHGTHEMKIIICSCHW